MSDTPKTDAMMTALLWRTGETLIADVEFADFARELERENAALREDKERMDWLESESVSEPIYSDNRRRRTILFFTGKPVLGEADTLRAAIDAARAKEAKP